MLGGVHRFLLMRPNFRSKRSPLADATRKSMEESGLIGVDLGSSE